MKHLKEIYLPLFLLFTLSFSWQAMSFETRYADFKVTSKLKLKARRGFFQGSTRIEPGNYKAKFSSRYLYIKLKEGEKSFPYKINEKKYKFDYGKKVISTGPYSGVKNEVKSCTYNSGHTQVKCRTQRDQVCKTDPHGHRHCVDFDTQVCRDEYIFYSGYYAQKYQSRKVIYSSGLRISKKSSNKVIAFITNKSTDQEIRSIKKTDCGPEYSLPSWANRD